MLHTTHYETEDGAVVPLHYDTPVPIINYPRRREEFCRRMATAEQGQTEVYCEIWGKDWNKGSEAQRAIWISAASRLMADPDIRLRIDQLKEPVARKFTKKFEYTLQRAFEQCDEAYRLAKAESDPKAMLKAIELQGKFAKLLAEQLDVTHRIGALDDTALDVLLKMKAALDKQKKKLVQINGEKVDFIDVEGTRTTALEAPAGPI